LAKGAVKGMLRDMNGSGEAGAGLLLSKKAHEMANAMEMKIAQMEYRQIVLSKMSSNLTLT